MRKSAIVITSVLVIAICLLLAIAAAIFGSRAVALLPRAELKPPGGQATLITASPPGVPTVESTSTPPATNSTLQHLLSEQIATNDPIDLSRRLRAQQSAAATPVSPRTFKIGDQTTFWVSREITGTYLLITATLRYATPHSYMWLENGETVPDADLKRSGDDFENKLYPTDRRYFGSEANPGIDNDPRVFILNTHFSGALGYFSSADEAPTFANRFSNQHELFYMNVRSLRPGSSSYDSVLAHEFVHMIYWNENPREGSWLNEGSAELAMQLNGYPQNPGEFVQNPDVQLDAWAPAGGGQLPHYAASYLFLSYLVSRFGEQVTRAMVSSGTRDIGTVQHALDMVSPGLHFDDVFADWVVANFIDEPELAPKYHYSTQPMGIRAQQDTQTFPFHHDGVVHQYGTDYIALENQGHDLKLTFQGDSQVRVVPTNQHSGKMMWWGSRADQSDTRLTREFDLTKTTHATLSFWTWYDIEANFDYAYVEASKDGQTWTTLKSQTTTTDDPNSANYGNGLTCKSGSGCDDGAPPARWVQEQADLSAFAGSQVYVRFEYVTDGIYAGPGIAIDDISIPEINFTDDAENSDNAWQADGFARIDNQLPQRFIVQAIGFGQDGRVSRIVPIALDKTNHGILSAHDIGQNLSRIVIAVSGSTPITWEVAHFSLDAQ